MRVALLQDEPRADVAALAATLRARGVDVTVAGAPPSLAPVEALLRRRAFEHGLTAVPFAYRALAGVDVAHAFALAPAFAAARAGRPLVLSFGAPVSREVVAARRLRFRFLKAALEAAAATTAPDEAVAASAERWLGVRPRVLDPAADADGLAALYDEVIASG